MTGSSLDPRGLNLAGWVGAHPANHRDVGHLLLTPASRAISEGMPLVAEALGLAAVPDLRGAPPAVPEQLAHLVLEGMVAHVVYGEGGDLCRPVDATWAAAAVDQGFVMVTCGMDPWTGDDLDQLDRYLLREQRLFMGRLQVLASQV